MTRQKQYKYTATPDKTRLQKPFVQVEGELTEAQLEAIAGGALSLN